MAGFEQTSLSVDFTDAAFTSSSSVRIERSSKEPEAFNQSYFRVHGADGHTLTSTSGNLVKDGSGLRKFVSEFIYFNGTALSPLNYPAALEVKIKNYGKFYDATGDVVTATLTYDSAKGAIKASKPIYGMVLVEYKSAYDMWRATFGGKCPSVESADPPADISVGSPDDDKKYEGLDPMVVYAWKDNKLDASLALNAPSCQFEAGGNSVAKAIMGSGAPKLAIEVDPQYPVRFINTLNSGGLEAGCALRCYPSDPGMKVTATSGKVYSPKGTFQEEFTQVLQFNNTSTARLKYQPKSVGSISVQVIGAKFSTQFGSTFVPDVRHWGDFCIAVTWTSKFAYQNPIKRFIDRDEIVITDVFGHAVPCFGSLEVTFMVEYDLRDFQFDYDLETKAFFPASVVASIDEEVGYTNLVGPSTRGYY